MRLRPDRIKIDRAFVRQVDTSATDAAIAGAILSLSRTLNLTVTAEGIERPAQLEWLRRRGCDEGQGFLLARRKTARRPGQRICRPPDRAVPARLSGGPHPP